MGQSNQNIKGLLLHENCRRLSGRKSSNRGKLKASNQDERVNLWQQHFQDLGKPPITPVLTKEKEFSL